MVEHVKTRSSDDVRVYSGRHEDTVPEARVRILAIEDNAVDQIRLQACAASFREKKYELHLVPSLEDANLALQHTEFDLVLIDFYLSDGTALDFIRTTKDRVSAPFVVLTGLQDARLEKEILSSGASDFIPKEELNAILLERVVKFALERQKAYNLLKEQALRDPLTGLYNRLGMESLLNQALENGSITGQPFAYLLIDIDNFKNINDTYGHAAGDAILRHVADSLRMSTRTSRGKDFAIRVGGDEFALLATELEHIDNVHCIIERITKKLSGPFNVEGYDIAVSLSIGVSVFPDDGDQQKDLMVSADFSLYQAKQTDGTAFEFFDRGMHQKVLRKQFIENSLDEAIAGEQFLLEYQPKYLTKDELLIGFEALVRWKHPEQGMIWPREFIHVTEKTGHILPLGEWVLKTACRQCVAWQKQMSSPVSIAVNVSIRQLLHSSFYDFVCEALEETGLSAEQLELEITESLIIQNLQESNKILRRLRKLGVIISLDDFGTGYSSLSRLRALPIDKIKIDRSLIKRVGANKFDTAIARTVLSLAKNLKLKAVAEGVETEEQLAFLKKAGCPEVQGYHFSKPMPAREIKKTIISVAQNLSS